MTAASTIRWVARGTTRPVSLPYGSVFFASGDLWSGIRVEEGSTAGAGELPQGNLAAHVVTLSVTLARIEVRWKDEPPVSGLCAPGTVTVFPASRPYSATWDRSRRAIFTEISPHLLACAAGEDGMSAPPELRTAFAQEDGFVRNVVLALRDLAQSSDAGDAFAGEMLGIALAAHLTQRYCTSRPPARPHHPLSAAQLRAVDEYIDAHLDSRISLRDLAAVAGVGVFRFAHAFKQSTGLSPHQHLLRRRIERARSLLGSGRSTLAEIAMRCGFSSQSHLTAVFHRLVGATPGSYRGDARARFR